MLSGRAYIGTSGWDYGGWRDDFYAGIARRDWLTYCAQRFTGLEINASFYRLQPAQTLRGWRRQTPADFRFALKAHRYLTHSCRLHRPLEPVRREREQARPLGSKLAVVLWQLPASLGLDMDRLETFISALRRWRAVRHAIEFRDRSWFSDEVAERLAAARLAVCQSDAADWPLWPEVTTDLVYLRLHGHTRTYASRYAERSLRRWARRIEGWLTGGRDVHLYFDNDGEGAAPRDAQRMLELVGH